MQISFTPGLSKNKKVENRTYREKGHRSRRKASENFSKTIVKENKMELRLATNLKHSGTYDLISGSSIRSWQTCDSSTCTDFAAKKPRNRQGR